MNKYTIIPSNLKYKGAPAVDDGIRRADELADGRLDRVEQETEFQSRRQQLEREQQSWACLEDQSKDVEGQLQAFDAEWTARMNASSLPGMPLDSLTGWIFCWDGFFGLVHMIGNLELF